jgi:hypothetical protein
MVSYSQCVGFPRSLKGNIARIQHPILQWSFGSLGSFLRLGGLLGMKSGGDQIFGGLPRKMGIRSLIFGFE